LDVELKEHIALGAGGLTDGTKFLPAAVGTMADFEIDVEVCGLITFYPEFAFPRSCSVFISGACPLGAWFWF